MRILRRLTSIYIIGLGFLAIIILVAFFSFHDIFISTEKILELTETLAIRQSGSSPSESDKLNQFIGEIRYIQIRAYIFFTIALLFASAGMLYLVYIYRRNIVEPLRNITSATRKMMEGQFEKLAVMEGTEIGTLAENFNSMRQTVKEKIGELEETVHEKQKVVRTLTILNELNSSIIFKLNVEEVLETIVSFSTILVRSKMSAILLVDKVSREVTHFASSLHRDHSNIVNVSNNVIHEVINDGMPIRLSAFSEGKRFTEMVEDTNTILKNFLAVPIIVKGDILGALIFFNKTDADEFSMEDEDMGLMASFQGAIAIEKSLFHEEIVQLAKTDGLTGLNNHRTFHEELDTEIKRAKRFSKYLTLLLIDIDYFKGFNDNYGHQEGDSALKWLSGIFRQNVRSIDSTARYGGEEFTIILPETLYDGGIRVAEKIRSEIDMHSFNIEDRRDRLTVSIGIAVFPNDAIDKEGLIKAADDALYMAKRMGRNRVVTFQQYKAETVRAK